MSSFSSDSESAAYDQMNCQHVSTSTASNFNLYYQNVRGLNTKINTFFGNVCDCEFDIVCLTETGLSSSVKSDELFGSGYSVFRRDRSFKECGLSRGGGVLIATKSTLSSSVVSIPQQYDYSIDLLAVKVKLGPNKIIVILTIYIPPSVNCDTYEKFIEFLCTLNCLLDNKECVIIGDFNSTYFSVNGTDRKSSSLQNFSSFANLTQYNCITNQDGRLLDLIFSNIECNVYEDPLPMVRVDPYHPPLNVHFAIKHTRFKNFKSNQSEWQFNYRKGNYINLYQHLCEFDWNVLPDTYDVNVMCDKFYYYLKEIFRLHIPLGPRKYSKRYPPWFSLDIIKMLKAKGKAYERYRKSPQRELYVEFQTLRSETKKLISASHKAYVHMIQNQIHEDPAKFWAFVNLQRGKSRIPGVVNYNESSHCTPTAVLNAFASFFASVFTDSDNTFCASSSINIQSLNVSLPLITNEDVVAACKKLKSKFTAGVDGIPAFLVKDCAVLFATPLTHQCHKMSLEKIQRRLLKYLAFKNDNIYPPRKFPENRLLERFSIPALEIRRNILAVSFLYKVVNGYIDTPEILEVIKFRVPQLQLRSTDTFYLPTARTKLLKKSPIYLMCSTFNKYGKSCDIFYDSQRCIRSIICLKSMANFQ
ncbi:uncharacterized protein LOC135119725 [Zophobas morio]|uniref:uncharacterized protein LOC135119448 n=1 Tax=Zophobas morio TaxID=2755281 RepID=UPI00308345E3